MKSKSFIWLLSLFFSLTTFSAHAENTNPQIEIQTNLGNLTIELYPEKAPKTVANFMQYVNSGFYQNTIFHRTIRGFMIQGGGFTSDMTEKPTLPPVTNEASNGLPNEAGTIAMARTSDPNSATSQFFINVANNIPLNYRGDDADSIGYCVFGKVVHGMNIALRISEVPTNTVLGFQDVPVQTVVIKKVTLLNKPH